MKTAKKYKLDKEDQEKVLLDAIVATKNTGNKTRNINIRQRAGFV